MRSIRAAFIQARGEDRAFEWLYPPLQFGYISSYLEKHYDGDVEVLVAGKVEELISASPDIVGISSVSQNFGIAEAIAGQVRSSLGVPIVVGGPHITALPQSLPECFDVGVVGEGEQAMLELLEAYRSDGSLRPDTLRCINGIAFHADGSVLVTARRKPIRPLDLIPAPDRHLFNVPRTHSQDGVVYVFTSRGCPFKCSFCSSTRFWEGFRAFSAERVVQEMEDVVDTYHPNMIYISDDQFLADRRRFAKIAELVTQEELHRRTSFWCLADARRLDEEVCRLMKSMNVVTVAFGAESGSDKVLRYLKGDTASVAQNQRAIDLIVENRMLPVCFFVIGSPDEEEKDLLQTYEFIHKNREKIRDIEVYALMPFPGTQIWELAKRSGLVHDRMDWQELDIDPENFDMERYPYMDRHLSKERFSEYQCLFRELGTELREYHRITHSFWLLRQGLQGGSRADGAAHGR